MSEGTVRKNAALRIECSADGCPVVFRAAGLQRRNYEAGKTVYCSRACQVRSSHLSLRCANPACGEEVTRSRWMAGRNKTGVAFCSAACRNVTGSKPRTGHFRDCVICAAKVWVKVSERDRKITCSTACQTEWQRRDRTTRVCRNCGASYVRAPSKSGPYCSRECGGAARKRRAPGDRYVAPTGYVWVWGEDGVKRQEHRVVMERLLGRPMLPRENVHHCNGDRSDNSTDGPLRLMEQELRSGNLALWSTSQPAGQRIPDKVAWAKEMLRLYEPEALATAPVQPSTVSGPYSVRHGEVDGEPGGHDSRGSAGAGRAAGHDDDGGVEAGDLDAGVPG